MLSADPVRDPAYFVGREREIVQITEALVAGRSCCVVGPAGSGKTSLLWHIQQMIDLVLDIPPQTIYLDLQSMRQADDFYAPVLRALGQSGSDELALGQFLHPTDTGPILLLLDNLAQAGSGWSSLIRSALRGWINDNKLQIVAASSQPLAQASPDLQSVLVQIPLPPFPEREARALLAQYLEQSGHEASADTATTLLTVAGGYPERLRRATELWTQSQAGAAFDWQRVFRQEYPQQPTLADEVRSWTPGLEAQASSETEVATRSTKQRRRGKAEAKPSPGYTLEDPSEYLCMLILFALSVGLWWSFGWWWGLAIFVLSMFGWIGIAWALVRIGGERFRGLLYVAATRWLPFVGRLAPRPLKEE